MCGKALRGAGSGPRAPAGWIFHLLRTSAVRAVDQCGAGWAAGPRGLVSAGRARIWQKICGAGQMI